MERTSTNYRLDIDGLRAIAVIAVILNHIDRTILPGGYLGVDIFFVISGYVITQSLGARSYPSFFDYIRGFYGRRVKRLLPALCLFVAVTFGVTLLFVAPGDVLAELSMRAGLSSLLGLSNIYLFRHATDYFGESAELNSFTHTWSLGVEEQFYLIFPLLIWIGGWARKTERGYRNTWLIVGALGVASFILYWWMLQRSPIWAFYMMPARFWELSLGAVIYFASLLPFQSASLSPKILKPLHIVAALLLLGVFWWPDAQLRQGIATTASVLLTALLIYSYHKDSIAYKFLTLKPVVFIGVISYSLYLWHWGVLVISRLTVGVKPRTIPYQLALMLLLAVTSYFFVEKPLRRASWKPFAIGPLKAGIFARSTLSIASVSLLAVLLASLHSKGFIYVNTQAPLLKKGTPSIRESYTIGKSTWTDEACAVNSAEKIVKNISYDECTFGDFKTAKRRFLVIGNSYSAAEMEMYEVIRQQELGSVTIISSHGSLPFADPDIKLEENPADDVYKAQVVPTIIGQMRSGDVVIMIYDTSDYYLPADYSESYQARMKRLGENLSRFSSAMEARGIYVIYQSPHTFIRESQCTPDTAMPQWWTPLLGLPCEYYSRTETLARRKPYMDMLSEVARQHRNFSVLDLFDVFCPGDTCGFYNEKGTFFYRDGASHASVEASRLARPLFLRRSTKL